MLQYEESDYILYKKIIANGKKKANYDFAIKYFLLLIKF